MIVKICGITNREDALAAVEAGASALGFNFYSSSPRYVTPEQAGEILGVIPAGVWKAGVFVNAPAEETAGLAARLGLDIVQLHGESPAPRGFRVWRAVPVGPGFDVNRLDDPAAEAFLLDTASAKVYGGTGRTFDWSVARDSARRVIIAGGLDEDNVREAIRQARPWGVDACSRLESSPGRKDHARMRRFVRAALSEGES